MILQADKLSLFGTKLPKVYISEVRLEPSIAIDRKKRAHTDDNNPPVRVKNEFGKAKLKHPGFDLSKKREGNEQLSVTIKLLLKETFDDDMNGTWYTNDFLSEYLKIKVVQSNSELFTEDVSAGDAGLYKQQREEREDDHLIKMKNVSVKEEQSCAASSTPDIQKELQGIHFELDEDGNRIYNIPYTVTFELKDLNPEHLTYYAVCFLDTTRLALDHNLDFIASPELKYIHGEITSETIIDDSKSQARAFVFYDSDSKIYTGKVFRVEQIDGTVRYHKSALIKQSQFYKGYRRLLKKWKVRDRKKIAGKYYHGLRRLTRSRSTNIIARAETVLSTWDERRVTTIAGQYYRQLKNLIMAQKATLAETAQLERVTVVNTKIKDDRTFTKLKNLKYNKQTRRRRRAPPPPRIAKMKKAKRIRLRRQKAVRRRKAAKAAHMLKPPKFAPGQRFGRFEESYISPLWAARDEKGNNRMIFAVDYFKLVRDKVQFGELLENTNEELVEDLLSYSRIQSIQVTRHRVDDADDNSRPQRLGCASPRRCDFSLPSPGYIVAQSSEEELGSLTEVKYYRGSAGYDQSKFEVVGDEEIDEELEEKIDNAEFIGSIKEVSVAFAPGMRFFSIVDGDIATFKDGRFRYKLQMRVGDATKMYMIQKLKELTKAKDEFNAYYGEACLSCNINSQTGKFTPRFIDYLDRRYPKIDSREMLYSEDRLENSIVDAPWITAISVYMDVVNFITNLNDEEGYEKAEQLYVYANPKSATPDSILKVLEVIAEAEEKLRTQIDSSGRARRNRAPGPPRSSSSRAGRKNSIFVKHNFRRLFDSGQIPDAGYDYLGIASDMVEGVKEVTDREFRNRCIQERRKYYSRYMEMMDVSTLGYRPLRNSRLAVVKAVQRAKDNADTIAKAKFAKRANRAKRLRQIFPMGSLDLPPMPPGPAGVVAPPPPPPFAPAPLRLKLITDFRMKTWKDFRKNPDLQAVRQRTSERILKINQHIKDTSLTPREKYALGNLEATEFTYLAPARIKFWNRTLPMLDQGDELFNPRRYNSLSVAMASARHASIFGRNLSPMMPIRPKRAMNMPVIKQEMNFGMMHVLAASGITIQKSVKSLRLRNQPLFQYDEPDDVSLVPSSEVFGTKTLRQLQFPRFHLRKEDNIKEIQKTEPVDFSGLSLVMLRGNRFKNRRRRNKEELELKERMNLFDPKDPDNAIVKRLRRKSTKRRRIETSIYNFDRAASPQERLISKFVTKTSMTSPRKIKSKKVLTRRITEHRLTMLPNQIKSLILGRMSATRINWFDGGYFGNATGEMFKWNYEMLVKVEAFVGFAEDASAYSSLIRSPAWVPLTGDIINMADQPILCRMTEYSNPTFGIDFPEEESDMLIYDRYFLITPTDIEVQSRTVQGVTPVSDNKALRNTAGTAVRASLKHGHRYVVDSEGNGHTSMTMKWFNSQEHETIDHVHEIRNFQVMPQAIYPDKAVKIGGPTKTANPTHVHRISTGQTLNAMRGTRRDVNIPARFDFQKFLVRTKKGYQRIERTQMERIVRKYVRTSSGNYPTMTNYGKQVMKILTKMALTSAHIDPELTRSTKEDISLASAMASEVSAIGQARALDTNTRPGGAPMPPGTTTSTGMGDDGDGGSSGGGGGGTSSGGGGMGY